jgi:DNA-binding transcriptional ArsR family regulator
LPPDLQRSANWLHLSKHLAYLERAHLVKKRRQGRSYVCTLRSAPFREISDWVEHYRIFWDQALRRLDEYLRASPVEKEKHHAK